MYVNFAIEVKSFYRERPPTLVLTMMFFCLVRSR